MINVDNGSIHIISYDQIRLLYKKFSELPAQSFECQLDGLAHVNEKDLLQILNKKCTIYVVHIGLYNKVIMNLEIPTNHIFNLKCEI